MCAMHASDCTRSSRSARLRVALSGAALALALASLAATAAAPAAARSATAIDAARVYQQRCARCHSVERVVADIAKRPAEGRPEWLDGFLARHYPPNRATREALAAWLGEQAEARR
jgi:mono/diheme cytochrome c family protein